MTIPNWAPLRTPTYQKAEGWWAVLGDQVVMASAREETGLEMIIGDEDQGETDDLHMRELESQWQGKRKKAPAVHRSRSRYREVSLACNADACSLLYTVTQVII